MKLLSGWNWEEKTGLEWEWERTVGTASIALLNPKSNRDAASASERRCSEYSSSCLWKKHGLEGECCKDRRLLGKGHESVGGQAERRSSGIGQLEDGEES